TVSSDQTICTGTAPADLVLSGRTGSVVRWEKSADALFTVTITLTLTSPTLAGATFGTLPADTWCRAIVQNGTCQTTESTAVKITVNNQSIGGIVNPPLASVCSGEDKDPVKLTLVGELGTVIKWQSSPEADF